MLFMCLKTLAFKVYIFADMEGCSMLTNLEQLTGEYGARMMAGDINACIEACFEAGATEVIIRDGHGSGMNIEPSQIDPRAKLIQGITHDVRFKDIDGSDAMIFLGYHAMSQTKNAIMAHTYSSLSIQMEYMNGIPVGEIGIDAAIASEHGVPVVLVTGDDKVAKEAIQWIPGVVVCKVKKGTSHLSGKCLPLNRSHALIKKKTRKALSLRKSIAPVKVDYPVTLRWELLPKGYARVYSPEFSPIANPCIKEKTGNNIEKLELSE